MAYFTRELLQHRKVSRPTYEPEAPAHPKEKALS